jgi:hypothetical protein
MRYDTKKWLEAVIALKGIQPFSMYQLPKHLQVKSEIKPLIENDILICEGSRWVREKKHYVKIWRVSPVYIESENVRTRHTHSETIAYVDTEPGKSVRIVSKARSFMDSGTVTLETAIVRGKHDVVYRETIHLRGVVV